MAEKKACVIFGPGRKAAADTVSERLRQDGYDVSTTEVASEEAKAVKAGDVGSLPTAVAECLADAEVCVFLIDDSEAAGHLGPLAGIASDGGARVVTVGGNPEELPTQLDDIIDGHVPSPENPDLCDVVNGSPDRIKPDNTRASGRDEDRVKCQ